MTLLAFLAIPSFVALCFLAVAHTLQTLNLRLAESTPFPEALLQEFFPAAPAFRPAQAVAARTRSYEYLLKSCTSRSSRIAFSRESSIPAFLRLPLPASLLREYRRSLADSSFRVMTNPDTRYKSFAARATFPRRRTRLSALTRRPRAFNTATALMAYS